MEGQDAIPPTIYREANPSRLGIRKSSAKAPKERERKSGCCKVIQELGLLGLIEEDH